MTALRVAMIGHGFMGAAHSQAWRNAPRFFDLPRDVELAVVTGRNPDALARSAQRYGWAEHDTDWRRVVERDDVDLVDICAPGSAHAEIAVAALEAGKHVLCEKPLANTVAEAETMADAAAKAAVHGVRAMVGFTYRRVPAVTLARDLVASGEIGEVRQARAVYLQDWLSDADAPLTWRLDRASAGSGALGDIGAHIVDDAAAFFAALSGGGLATFEASRMAPGRKNGLRFEISGSRGALAFDLEDLNSLQVYRADDAAAGFRRVLVTEPHHPYVAAWWPPGHGLGYEHAFTHQVVDLVRAIEAGEQPRPSFDEGLQVQRVLDAVETSAGAEARWTSV